MFCFVLAFLMSAGCQTVTAQFSNVDSKNVSSQTILQPIAEYTARTIVSDSSLKFNTHFVAENNLIVNDSVKSKTQKSVLTGGIIGATIGSVFALVFWDELCDPGHPACGALSKEMYGVKIPALVVGAGVGGLLGAGLGALANPGKSNNDKNTAVQVTAGFSPMNAHLPKHNPTVTLRFPLKKRYSP